jgi:hypothetical protein
MDENRVTRSIPCDDAAGRQRVLEVVGEPGHIWLNAPPGGAAGVHPRNFDMLKSALIDALTVAVRSAR